MNYYFLIIILKCLALSEAWYLFPKKETSIAEAPHPTEWADVDQFVFIIEKNLDGNADTDSPHLTKKEQEMPQDMMSEKQHLTKLPDSAIKKSFSEPDSFKSLFPFLFGPKKNLEIAMETEVFHDVDKSTDYLDFFPSFGIQRDPDEPLIRVERVAQNNPTTAATNELPNGASVAPPKLVTIPPQPKGYRMALRDIAGDTSGAYHQTAVQPMAPVVDAYHMFLVYSLPVAICWTLIAIFCIFGLRPDGPVSKRIFSNRYNPLEKKI